MKKKTTFTLAEGATHANLSNGTCKECFTLAEVLITLGVIGIVAALTLPNLFTRIRNNIYSSQIKQSYSILTNGIKRLMAEDSTTDLSGTEMMIKLNQGNVSEAQEQLLSVFKIAISGESQNIDTTKHIKGLNETDYGQYADVIKADFPYYFILNNGNLVAYNPSLSNIMVDTNGANTNPNTYGKDIFFFSVNDKGNISSWTGAEAQDACGEYSVEVNEDRRITNMDDLNEYFSNNPDASCTGGPGLPRPFRPYHINQVDSHSLNYLGVTCPVSETTSGTGSGRACSGLLLQNDWKINY